MLVNRYAPVLGQYGLGTGTLNAIRQHLGWARDQVPMLNREANVLPLTSTRFFLRPEVDAGVGDGDQSDLAGRHAGRGQLDENVMMARVS